MTKFKAPPKNPITERRKFRERNPQPYDWGRTKLNPDKGLKGGSCNRTACQRPGANYYNYSTQKYYCKNCAEDLNRVNRFDAHKMYGHDLCILHD